MHHNDIGPSRLCLEKVSESKTVAGQHLYECRVLCSGTVGTKVWKLPCKLINPFAHLHVGNKLRNFVAKVGMILQCPVDAVWTGDTVENPISIIWSTTQASVRMESVTDILRFVLTCGSCWTKRSFKMNSSVVPALSPSNCCMLSKRSSGLLSPNFSWERSYWSWHCSDSVVCRMSSRHRKPKERLQADYARCHVQLLLHAEEGQWPQSQSKTAGLSRCFFRRLIQ